MNEQSEMFPPDLFPARTQKKCGSCGGTLMETQYMWLCLVCDFRKSKPQKEIEDARSEE